MPRKPIDITGERYGRLVALRPTRRVEKHSYWEVRCDCGLEFEVRLNSIRNGSTVSCGCYKREGAHLGWLERKPADQIGYEAAHGRVRRDRGPARDLDCVDCAAPAAEWSLSASTPAERLAYGFRLPYPRPMPYSGDPTDYEPRCKRCHALHDKAWASSR